MLYPKNGEALLERNEIISELTDTYARRRAEHWFMVVMIMVVILALAAGLSLSIGDNLSLRNELIIWGSALVWIFIFALGHVKEMSRLKRAEKKVIDRLKKDERFRFTEKPEPSLSRWGTAIFALLLGGLLIYIGINALLMDGFGWNLSADSTAEIIILLFAALLALIGAFSRIFPLRQRFYNVRVSVLEGKPEMIKYRTQRVY